MEMTKKRLKKMLADVGMTNAENSLLRIIEKEKLNYNASSDLAERRKLHAEKTIYQIAKDRLPVNDIDDIMEMVELYSSGERELFFEIGYILGLKKENSPS